MEPHLQGAAGCLRGALPYLDDLFVVPLDDAYTAVDPEDLVRRFATTGAEAGRIVLRDGEERIPSNVAVRFGRGVTYEKGSASRSLPLMD